MNATAGICDRALANTGPLKIVVESRESCVTKETIWAALFESEPQGGTYYRDSKEAAIGEFVQRNAATLGLEIIKKS